MRKILLFSLFTAVTFHLKAQTFAWTDIITGINSGTFGRPDCISILPLDNTTLIGGTSSGIYKSTNNGQNWALVSDQFFICQEIFKTSAGKLVAAGQGLATQAGKHIQISSDNGSSWSGINLSGTTSAEVRDITADNAGNLYIPVYSNSQSALIGVHKSTDGGNTWTQLNQAPLASGILYMDGIYTEDGNTILVGSNKGLFKSTDAGTSFTMAAGIASGNYVYRIRKAPSGAILAATDDGIFASTDQGSSFTQVIPVSSFIFDFIIDGPFIIAGVYNTGIVKYNATTYAQEAIIGSTANGLSSSRIRAINTNPAGIYFAASEGTSDDNGRKFHTTSSGGTNLETLPLSAFNIYPNPASDFLNINPINPFSTISITDISGKTLKLWENTTTNAILSVADLPAGIYTLKIENKGTVSVQKICVSH